MRLRTNSLRKFQLIVLTTYRRRAIAVCLIFANPQFRKVSWVVSGHGSLGRRAWLTVYTCCIFLSRHQICSP